MSDIAWRRHPDRRAQYIFNHILFSEIPDLDHSERVFLAYAAAVRYQADFSIDPDITFHTKLSPKMQYLAKMAGLAARYLYTATGMSATLLGGIWLEIENNKIVIRPETPPLTQGHNTNKRLDILNKHI